MAVYDSLEALRRSPTPLRRLFDPWYLSGASSLHATSGHQAHHVQRLRLHPALPDGVHQLSFLLPIGRLRPNAGAVAAIIATYPSAMLLAEERPGRLGAGSVDPGEG
jgi:hypothetical protein